MIISEVKKAADTQVVQRGEDKKCIHSANRKSSRKATFSRRNWNDKNYPIEMNSDWHVDGTSLELCETSDCVTREVNKNCLFRR
jgi:hypothetical protein